MPETVWLVYTPTPNEGPEPQRLGHPYEMTLYPNVPFECEVGLAEALTKVKPGLSRAADPSDAADTGMGYRSVRQDTIRRPHAPDAPPPILEGSHFPKPRKGGKK